MARASGPVLIYNSWPGARKRPLAVVPGSRRTGEGYAFSLTDPSSGAPHLPGRTVPR